MHSKGKTSEEYVRELLDIPGNYKAASVVAIGYPEEKREPQNEDELMFEKVFVNKYGKSYRK